MSAHPHAALMMAYARDAAECAEPWLRWDGRDPSNPNFAHWHTLGWHPSWLDGIEYRRKARPLECWVIVSRDGHMGCAWETRADAEESVGDYQGVRIVHFREVPNE